MYTTLNKIREHRPCKSGWETLLKHLGKTEPDDEPLPLLTILDSNGLNDALWCLRAVAGFEKEKLLLRITFAREVEHLMPAESKKALDVFERYANGFETACDADAAAADAAAADAAAADAAARAAWFAAGAAYADAASVAAARAAWFAAAAAYAAAYDAAVNDAAARAACVADAAADAARAASSAACAAVDAVDAARSTIRVKQEAQLRELLERTCTQL